VSQATRDPTEESLIESAGVCPSGSQAYSGTRHWLYRSVHFECTLERLRSEMLDAGIS